MIISLIVTNSKEHYSYKCVSYVFHVKHVGICIINYNISITVNICKNIDVFFFFVDYNIMFLNFFFFFSYDYNTDYSARLTIAAATCIHSKCPIAIILLLLLLI